MTSRFLTLYARAVGIGVVLALAWTLTGGFA